MNKQTKPRNREEVRVNLQAHNHNHQENEVAKKRKRIKRIKKKEEKKNDVNDLTHEIRKRASQISIDNAVRNTEDEKNTNSLKDTTLIN